MPGAGPEGTNSPHANHRTPSPDHPLRETKQPRHQYTSVTISATQSRTSHTNPYHPQHAPSIPHLNHLARNNRNNPTDAEQTSSTASTRPQQSVEPRLNKVDVVSQRIPNALFFHKHETRAIHQAPALVWSRGVTNHSRVEERAG